MARRHQAARLSRLDHVIPPRPRGESVGERLDRVSDPEARALARRWAYALLCSDDSETRSRAAIRLHRAGLFDDEDPSIDDLRLVDGLCTQTETSTAHLRSP